MNAEIVFFFFTAAKMTLILSLRLFTSVITGPSFLGNNIFLFGSSNLKFSVACLEFH